MRIEKATQADLTTIVSLNRQFHLDIPDFRWDTEQWIAEQIGSGTLHILRNTGKVYGAVCLQLAMGNLPPDEACIETIAIDKDLHGGGYGKKLVEFSANEAKQGGKSKLVVESFCEYGLEDFYRKCGFELEPKQGEFYGHPYNVFSMKLK